MTRPGGPLTRYYEALREEPGGETPTAVELPCVTQDPTEPAPTRFLAVCTGRGEHLACSLACVGTGCGGHLVCTPCRDLAIADGWVWV